MNDGEIAKKIKELFDLRPKAIEQTLKLRQPMYLETASYGHMGRKNEMVRKTFTSMYHEPKTIEVELFTWEKLNLVNEIKNAFGLGQVSIISFYPIIATIVIADYTKLVVIG